MHLDKMSIKNIRRKYALYILIRPKIDLKFVNIINNITIEDNISYYLDNKYEKIISRYSENYYEVGNNGIYFGINNIENTDNLNNHIIENPCNYYPDIYDSIEKNHHNSFSIYYDFIRYNLFVIDNKIKRKQNIKRCFRISYDINIYKFISPVFDYKIDYKLLKLIPINILYDFLKNYINILENENTYTYTYLEENNYIEKLKKQIIKYTSKLYKKNQIIPEVYKDIKYTYKYEDL